MELEIEMILIMELEIELKWKARNGIRNWIRKEFWNGNNKRPNTFRNISQAWNVRWM